MVAVVVIFLMFLPENLPANLRANLPENLRKNLRENLSRKYCTFLGSNVNLPGKIFQNQNV